MLMREFKNTTNTPDAADYIYPPPFSSRLLNLLHHDDVHPAVRVHNVRDLPNWKRKGCLFKGRLHLALSKHSQVPSVPGTAAVGFHFGNRGKVVASFHDLFSNVPEFGQSLLLAAGDCGFAPARRVPRPRML